MQENITGIVSGIPAYATVTELPAVTTDDNGKQARVYADGDPANNTFWIVQSGAWQIDTSFADSLETAIQPLVDEAEAAAASVSDIVQKQSSEIPSVAITDEDGNAAMTVSATKVDHPDINQIRSDSLTAGGSLVRQAGADRLAITDEEGNALAIFDLANPSGGEGSGAPASTYDIEPSAWSYGDSDAYSREANLESAAYLFVIFGQSNAIGTNNDADALISTTPTYADNALMLGASPRVTTGGNSLTSLKEVSSGSLKETAVSAMVNHFIREHDDTFSALPTVVGFAAGVGGQPMMALKRGSDGYEAMLAGVDDAVTGLRERGFRKITTVVSWIGSEGDADKFFGMNAGWWTTMAQAFFRGVQQDIMERTGEATAPIVVLQPISYNPDSLNGSVPLPSGGSAVLDLWDAPVLRGMMALDGVDNIRVAPPAYAYPHSTAGGDVLHRNNTGHYWCGLNLAKVAWAELIGTGWRGCRPSRTDKPYFATATQIVIPFDTQGGGPASGGGDDGTALVLDTSGDYVTTITNHGLEFDDGSGSAPSISAVSVDGRNLVIDLSGAPTGLRPRVIGGMTPSTADGVGPVTGPRTTIRDKFGWTPIHSGAGTDPIYDFALPFVLEL
ncbi:hypothetical protein [Sphingopyxis indica]|uniref:hypothetical protein n=1 Tax=Sphingopyxis indica TaxID=436663 RepID=UPI00112FDBAC|nr:hypothetical protein [Sphingopyxis indica]